MEHGSTGYNGFDIIAYELGITPDALMLGIQKEADSIRQRVSESKLASFSLLLSEDMKVVGSQMPFITTGQNLLSHLEPVFKKLSADPHIFRPPVIQPTAEITAHLRKKILDRFSAVTRRLAASERFGRIYSQFEKDRDLKAITKDFQDGIEHYMTTPGLINDVLSSIRHPHKSSILENNLNGAFIAMAVLHHYEGFDLAGNARREAMVEMGLSILFQDLGCLSEQAAVKHDSDDHCDISAESASQMGLPERSLETIRHHHRVADEDGRPIYAMRTPPLFERVAVTVNHFIPCILPDGYNLSVTQAIFILNHYAAKSFLDTAAVRGLGLISIGERKSAIFAKAFEVTKQCPKNAVPYIWDINTPVPNRLICSQLDCEYAANESVKLYNSLSFDVGGQRFHLPEGEYQKCAKLTRTLNLWLLSTGRYKDKK